ncbi:tetratricopeptide repeat protein [Streptosporangiaceae bacterium NEAU-GS5]|nr:tetratricopeptide repeat protein [Streptosporangiaceae bacterium NEAU-GS5]
MGREDLLGEVRSRLLDGGDRPVVVALCGLGGVGKTSVAVEYAHRYQADYGVIWQITVDDPAGASASVPGSVSASVSAAFTELAALVGVRQVVDAANPVHQVHAALAARPDRWLLVLDNAADVDAVREVLPPAGRGHVLVTSRSAHWPKGQALPVPVLDHQVAAGFLLARSGDSDRAAAEQIAQEVGTLPLALEQAGAYLHDSGRRLAEYVGLFRTRRGELLAHGGADGYAAQVATTWSLSFQRLQQSDPSAVAVLRLLAFYGPDDIPVGILLNAAPGEDPDLHDEGIADVLMPVLGDPLRADRAIAALRRYSLVSQPVQGRVSMHRLVQAVTVDQLPDEQRAGWRQAAAELLDAVLPEDPDRRQNWPVYAALAAHASMVLDLAGSGMGAIIEYLHSSGDYATGLILQRQRVQVMRDQLGSEHPDMLSAQAMLASLTGRAGDVARARDQCAALLPIQERVLGIEHPDTLTSRANLAFWSGAAGDVARARDQCAALLPIRERVLGIEHPDTLTSRANLASWSGLAGDAVEARDQYAALLPIRERVLGIEHPDTLTSRANLAFWSGAAGDAVEARDQYAALLPIRERVSGAEHPSTLTARANLARWSGLAGDAVGARDQYAALLPIRERVSGAEHPETLTDRANMAYWIGEAGDAAQARDQYAALMPIQERVSGAEHPETLTARANLARWSGQAGDAIGARDLYAALMPIRERVSGAEHPETLSARANLTYWTRVADGDSS